MTSCPYCGGEVVPPDVRNNERPKNAHGTCTKCGLHPRATVRWSNGVPSFTYSAEGKEHDPETVKSIHVQKRISPNDLRLLQNGEAELKIVDNGRLKIKRKYQSMCPKCKLWFFPQEMKIHRCEVVTNPKARKEREENAKES